MKRFHQGVAIAFCLLLLLFVASRAEYAAPRGGAAPANAQAAADKSPFTDFHGEAPGNVHHITPADLPAPYATKSAAVFTPPIPKPADAWPKAPDGFKVERYAEKLEAPRLIQTAPNGDFFVAETLPGKIVVLRGITSDGKPEKTETFATGLKFPFGIAFYPPGPHPKYVYVGNTNSVERSTGGSRSTLCSRLHRHQ